MKIKDIGVGSKVYLVTVSGFNDTDYRNGINPRGIYGRAGHGVLVAYSKGQDGTEWTPSRVRDDVHQWIYAGIGTFIDPANISAIPATKTDLVEAAFRNVRHGDAKSLAAELSPLLKNGAVYIDDMDDPLGGMIILAPGYLLGWSEDVGWVIGVSGCSERHGLRARGLAEQLGREGMFA